MKIAIIGYGKMGKEIEKIALSRHHKISIIIDKHNISDLTIENLKKSDVAIEFTQPTTAYDNYLKCFAANTPIVSGTTGWLERLSEIKNICKTRNKNFFYASNFSVGVNLFFRLNKFLAKIMKEQSDYDIELFEKHHVHKLDAPSGTAISLAEDIIAISKNKKTWVNDATNESNELQILSQREGEITGVHNVKYSSNFDEINITHNAKNRKGFATGAVLAAEFLYTQDKAGFYDMNDLLKI